MKFFTIFCQTFKDSRIDSRKILEPIEKMKFIERSEKQTRKALKESEIKGR